MIETIFAPRPKTAERAIENAKNSLRWAYSKVEETLNVISEEQNHRHNTIAELQRQIDANDAAITANAEYAKRLQATQRALLEHLEEYA